MKFRTDINGLRAIAVMAVVLFHFNPSWVPGGFAGVDVFFVISGFLMTGLIFRGLENNNFSIINFYVARANRIIPALSVVCLALLVFGWFYLTPLDYRALGKHVASSMGFVSNIIYWRESGYFDAASHSKWLLHTWSLSVEWQFYIIYPLVLVVMRKFMSVKAMKATILLGTVLGFIFCVIGTYKWPNPAYYLLPTRAWEMMIGGVAYLYPIILKEKQKKLLEWFGLALIIGSYFLISKDNLWPGYLAIFPVLGSFLIIQAHRNDSFITGNVISQKIGAWSYSIYLWHWPLVVAIYYFSLNDLFIYFGIALSVLFGFLSNKYIEKIKFRNNFISIFDFLKCKPLYISLAIILTSNIIYKHTGVFYSHIPRDVFYGMTVDKNTDNNGLYTWDKHLELDKKKSFKQSESKILIIGDSQAGDIINTLSETGVNNNVDVISRILSVGCGAFYLDGITLSELLDQDSNSKYRESCLQSMSRIINDTVVEKADVIIVAMQWYDRNVPFILKSLSNIRLKNPTARLYLVGGKIFKEEVPIMLYNSYILGVNVNDYAFNEIGNKGTLNYQYQNDTFEGVQADLNFNYVNMTNILCENKKCTVASINNEPYYYDTGHLTRIGAKYLGERMKSKMIFPSSLYSK